MENLDLNRDFWKHKRVFVTGHTGFKGGWFVLWLQKIEAIVSGYSLSPPTQPNLYTIACIDDGIRSTTADVRQMEQLQTAMQAADPELAFHFAAQPLVRASYADPVHTYAVNVMGTVHFLEAVRHTPSVRAAVVVTSDKCYENNDDALAHQEHDPMGGSNPYASSKGCAELVTDAYRRSFFADGNVAVASVRAGNVIGGGDWAQDRLIPDMVRSFDLGQVLSLRYPYAVRPWQHVLDPLNGYLRLAEQMWRNGIAYAKGWNFGPGQDRPWSVLEVVREAARLWGPNAQWAVGAEDRQHEDNHLNIDASMARTQLKWEPKLDIKTALKWTIDWYRTHLNGGMDMRGYSMQQIERYESIH